MSQHSNSGQTPDRGGSGQRADPDGYLGLPGDEAERRAATHGWEPVRRLPADAVITMEYLAGRLNLVVDGGVVTRCWEG